MMIARWHIDARFGHKQQVIESLKRWYGEIGSQVGWTPENTRMITGSVGAPESAIEVEIKVADLADLNAAWDKLATIEPHQQWSHDLEPHVVSGTSHWQVFRVID